MRYDIIFLLYFQFSWIDIFCGVLVLKGQFTLMYDFLSSEQHQRDDIY